ncbi:hypothetical protein OBBRIDRAFT_828980 [Obba rivulosa]|uniref:Uncharacterized protein n=1 Tax=Obba rivulosa TaxID=1052685 RepID=A0A8E2DFW3_9APHY|nr:hypothetical protein OBBRIDRAFT_828980 [Obba rivulosa]
MDVKQLCSWPLIVRAYSQGKFAFGNTHDRELVFVAWVRGCGRDPEVNDQGAEDADSMLAAGLSRLICKIERPFEHEELALSHEKFLFFLTYARKELHASQPGQCPAGPLAVAVLLCANAPGQSYRQSCRTQMWELVDHVYRDWQTANPRNATGRACLLMHIAFLMNIHEQPSINPMGDGEELSQLVQDRILAMRTAQCILEDDALDGDKGAELVRVWPVIVHSFPNNRKRRDAFVAWASTCFHPADTRCRDSDADASAVAALSRLMFYIKDPFESEYLALAPTERVLFHLQYALQQVEAYAVDDSAMYSCAVALLLCASAPEPCYQEHYRRTAWMLIDTVFACVMSRSLWVDERIRQCIRDHIAFLLRKHDHGDLRGDLGPGILQFLNAEPTMSVSLEWAIEIGGIIKEHVDLETLVADAHPDGIITPPGQHDAWPRAAHLANCHIITHTEGLQPDTRGFPKRSKESTNASLALVIW